MKKIYTLALAALAAFALTGCENDNMDNIKDNTPAEGSKVVFTAGLDAIARTAPAAGGVTTWTADDTIGVWDGTSYVDATIDNISGSTITFSAEVDPAAASYVAVTPADAWNGVDGENVVLNFATTQSAGKQVVAVATFEKPATEGTFRNVNNLLRFTVKKAAVKWAKLTGNKGEKFGTAVSVAPATGEGTATGEATELVVPITTGENFLALPQGVNLAEGFTITLYGDEALTDYQGEVCSKGAVTLARNQQRNLGTIDGWIDNWKLWEAGKSITIAGVEYSKASTGVDGELVTASGSDFDIRTKMDVGFAGNQGTKVLFLEEADSHNFTFTSFINIGNSTTVGTRCDMRLISRFDNQPVTIKPTRYICLCQGSLAMRSINYDTSNITTDKYPFRVYNVETISAFHLDNCTMKFSTGSNVAYAFLGNSASYRGIKDVKIVNSTINLATTSNIDFFRLDGTPYLDQFETVTFDNNTVYCSTGSMGTFQFFRTSGKQPSSKVEPTTIFNGNNNTFYNVNPYLFQIRTTSHITVKDNIFSASSKLTGSQILVYAVKGTPEYSYTIEGNISDQNAGVYYFNTNATYQGVYYENNISVTKVGETATILKTADVTKGIFEQTEAYKDKGAQKLF